MVGIDWSVELSQVSLVSESAGTIVISGSENQKAPVRPSPRRCCPQRQLPCQRQVWMHALYQQLEALLRRHRFQNTSQELA